jgi:hypothetical protein
MEMSASTNEAGACACARRRNLSTGGRLINRDLAVEDGRAQRMATNGRVVVSLPWAAGGHDHRDVPHARADLVTGSFDAGTGVSTWS